MADSDITVSGLGAFSGFNQILLAWEYDDPNVGGLLGLGLKHFEIWSSGADDIDTAMLIKTTTSNFYIDSGGSAGLSAGETRYYWVRAKNNSGLYGEFYPATEAGIEGSTQAAFTGVFEGTLQASEIIGSTFKTAESGTRIEIDATTNTLRAYIGSDYVAAIGNNNLESNAMVVGFAFGAAQFGGFFTNTASGGVGMKAVGSNGANAVQAMSTGVGSAILASGNNAAATTAQITGIGTYNVWSSNSGGGYAFYAQIGGYGPFTGAHDGLLRRKTCVAEGDILCDLSIVLKKDVSNTLAEVELSSRPRQSAIGIFTARRRIRSREPLACFDRPTREVMKTFDRVIVNAVGEGQVNVCGEGGDIEAGDLLCTSSMRGKAMRQQDDIVRSYTVARAREAAKIAPGESAMIACIYMCG